MATTKKPSTKKTGTKGKSAGGGKKVSIVFASIKPKNAKSSIDLVAKVSESTITALDIKLKKAAASKAPSLVDNKSKTAKYLPRKNGTKSARRKLRCSADGVQFYSVIVPSGCSYSKAIEALTKNSKAKVFITPAGTKYETGDTSKK
ncbi:hypothetical protein PseudUWO311_00585 [Pseudanabaena sp. UWO311]|uniref:hypothetical protein n=1 Tax=Pseudanabaena sp. UWO311 TaxID=2487337 RepID=UPI001159E745|nr:hypothetical protein [Pseudanabaena sp. UWO311]TYQ29427.1 hypothetical protein PseudUWO311_00585 [Pseudanabaena sp. UWO311]